MASLDVFFKLLQGCVESVHKMPSRNFNEKQCAYLLGKLEVVVEVAKSFLEVSRTQYHDPESSWKVIKWVEVFKLLLALGKQVEDFIAGCSRADWVEAAMTLANMAEYVSSVGFNLELCKVLLSEGDSAGMQSGLSNDDVDSLSRAEEEVVKHEAIKDKEDLLKKVSLVEDFSGLAQHLLRRLANVHADPIRDDGHILSQMFDWVIPVGHGEQLGEGASARVYKAMWLGTPVAQKTFVGPENPYFLREVGILSQLCHPNVTSMFCSKMNKRQCSIIMELMDNDLFRLMERRASPPFSIPEALDLMLQIAEGVNYLHSQKIIHRDLKSMNILVKMMSAGKLETGYVQAKVVDFGLSKTKEFSATSSHMSYNEGTPRWIAPELIKPPVADSVSGSEDVLKYKFKCDVYSFAMVCFEILTGDVPFAEESDRKKVKDLVLAGARPELPSDCPVLLKALIERCWLDSAKERPTFPTICSTLKYLKYVYMRELRLDSSSTEESGRVARVTGASPSSSSSLKSSNKAVVLPGVIVLPETAVGRSTNVGPRFQQVPLYQQAPHAQQAPPRRSKPDSMPSFRNQPNVSSEPPPPQDYRPSSLIQQVSFSQREPLVHDVQNPTQGPVFQLGLGQGQGFQQF